jgi:hypothetical protein
MADDTNPDFGFDSTGAMTSNYQSSGSPDDFNSWGWKQIMAAITGLAGAGADDTAGFAGAGSVSNPQTLYDAADTLFVVQRTLQMVAQSVTAQANALAGGANAPWQGEAATTFTAAMNSLSQQIQANADVLSGGDAGINSVPNQLIANGEQLQEAIAKIHAIDSWYAQQAVNVGVKPMKDGLIPVSHRPDIVAMLDRDMRQVITDLAGRYTVTVDAIRPPDTAGTFTPNAGGQLPADPYGAGGLPPFTDAGGNPLTPVTGPGANGPGVNGPGADGLGAGGAGANGPGAGGPNAANAAGMTPAPLNFPGGGADGGAGAGAGAGGAGAGGAGAGGDGAGAGGVGAGGPNAANAAGMTPAPLNFPGGGGLDGGPGANAGGPAAKNNRLDAAGGPGAGAANQPVVPFNGQGLPAGATGGDPTGADAGGAAADPGGADAGGDGLQPGGGASPANAAGMTPPPLSFPTANDGLTSGPGANALDPANQPVVPFNGQGLPANGPGGTAGLPPNGASPANAAGMTPPPLNFPGANDGLTAGPGANALDPSSQQGLQDPSGNALGAHHGSGAGSGAGGAGGALPKVSAFPGGGGLPGSASGGGPGLPASGISDPVQHGDGLGTQGQDSTGGGLAASAGGESASGSAGGQQAGGGGMPFMPPMGGMGGGAGQNGGGDSRSDASGLLALQSFPGDTDDAGVVVGGIDSGGAAAGGPVGLTGLEGLEAPVQSAPSTPLQPAAEFHDPSQDFVHEVPATVDPGGVGAATSFGDSGSGVAMAPLPSSDGFGGQLLPQPHQSDVPPMAPASAAHDGFSEVHAPAVPQPGGAEDFSAWNGAGGPSGAGSPWTSGHHHHPNQEYQRAQAGPGADQPVVEAARAVWRPDRATPQPGSSSPFGTGEFRSSMAEPEHDSEPPPPEPPQAEDLVDRSAADLLARDAAQWDTPRTDASWLG